MEELLPALIADAEQPPAQSSHVTVDEVTAMINTNRASTEGYLTVSCLMMCYV